MANQIFTMTELAIILSALEQDKKNNPYPNGFVNDRRESAIDKVRVELKALDKEMKALIKRKLMGEKDEE